MLSMAFYCRASATCSVPMPLLLKVQRAPTGASVEAWSTTSDCDALTTRMQWSLISIKRRTRKNGWGRNSMPPNENLVTSRWLITSASVSKRRSFGTLLHWPKPFLHRKLASESPVDERAPGVGAGLHARRNTLSRVLVKTYLAPKHGIYGVRPRDISGDQGRYSVVTHVERSIFAVIVGAADVVAPGPDPDLDHNHKAIAGSVGSLQGVRGKNLHGVFFFDWKRMALTRGPTKHSSCGLASHDKDEQPANPFRELHGGVIDFFDNAQLQRRGEL